MGDEAGIRPEKTGKVVKRNGFWVWLWPALGVSLLGAFVSPLGDPLKPVIASTFADMTNPVPESQASGDFVVLVANFDGDDADQKVTKTVRESLAARFENLGGEAPIRVLSYPRTLRLGSTGNLITARENAEAEGRAWMKATNADLLIWGAVRQGTVVRYLWGTGPSRQYAFGVQDQSVSTSIGDEVAPVVALTFAATAYEAYFNLADTETDKLKEAKIRLAAITEKMSKSFPSIYAAQILNALGLVSTRLGEIEKSSPAQQEAIAIFRKGLALEPDGVVNEAVPSVHAMLLTNLGLAQHNLWDQTKEKQWLTEAEASQRRALSLAANGGDGLRELRANIMTNLATVLDDAAEDPVFTSPSFPEIKSLRFAARDLYLSLGQMRDAANASMLYGLMYFRYPTSGTPETKREMASAFREAAQRFEQTSDTASHATSLYYLGTSDLMILSAEGAPFEEQRFLEANAALQRAVPLYASQNRKEEEAFASNNLCTLGRTGAPHAKSLQEKRQILERALSWCQHTSDIAKLGMDQEFQASTAKMIEDVKADLAKAS